MPDFDPTVAGGVPDFNPTDTLQKMQRRLVEQRLREEEEKRRRDEDERRRQAQEPQPEVEPDDDAKRLRALAQALGGAQLGNASQSPAGGFAQGLSSGLGTVAALGFLSSRRFKTNERSVKDLLPTVPDQSGEFVNGR